MLLDYERQLIESGVEFIGGIDEAGRGPLAGPVVVAGVIMPLDNASIIDGVNDSKKLSAKKREKLYEEITARAIDIQIAVIDNVTIDKLNILNATKQGMIRCVQGFSKVDCVLIDAVQIDVPVRTLSIVHGDALSYSIAAASIVAKVTRDRMMESFAVQYPEYNFAKHKGYGTAEHIAALKKYGPCPIHRRSFIGHFVDVSEM